jgi:hypothetical protein
MTAKGSFSREEKNHKPRARNNVTIRMSENARAVESARITEGTLINLDVSTSCGRKERVTLFVPHKEETRVKTEGIASAVGEIK